MATITYNGPSFLFSQNAGSVNVTRDSLDQSIVLVADGVDYEIPAASLSESFDLRDLLEAVALQGPAIQIEASSPYVVTIGDNVELQVLTSDSQISASLRLTVLPGGVSGEDASGALAAVTERFLTLGPQIRKAFGWSKEQLFIQVLYDRYGHETLTVQTFARYYTPSGIFTMQTSEALTVAYGSVVGIPIDLEDANAQGAAAVDVWARISGQSGDTDIAPVRFIISPSRSNYRGFLFRNSLGGFETVYSRGELKNVPQYETGIFRNGHAESETDPTLTEYMEADSGLFAGEADRAMWMDFIRSDEKYMVEQDGTVSRIVLDETSPDLTMKDLGHFSFRFHKADDPVGGGQSLPEYETELPVPEGEWSKNIWLNDRIWDDSINAINN